MAPKTQKNKVNRLDYNIPIVHADGRPTDEFQRKWLQQAAANATVPDLTTIAGVSAILDLISAVKGSLLNRGTTTWQALAGATGHDGWLLTWNDATGLPEWRVQAISAIPSAFWIDGSGVGQMALVDANGQEVLDGSGFGIYIPNPVLPDAMIPSQTLRTRQVITSGTVYTKPAGVRQILVRMVGGGGGSGGSSTLGDGGNGTAGTDSTFNAYAAKGGALSNNVGTGSGYSGNGADGTGATSVFRRNGESSVTCVVGNPAANQTGSNGGNTPLGAGAFNLNNAAANTGGGAGGAGIVAAANALPTAGGGGAEYVELIFNNPAASYVVAIGPGGTGGAAGTNGLAGKAGGSGLIIVDEFY